MKRKGNVTFVIFTLNEEHRLPYVLRALHGYGDIMIIDNWSTDKTIEIAKEYTTLVFQRDKIVSEDEVIEQYIYERATTPWFYWGYADEILPRPLVQKIADASLEDRYRVVWMMRKNYNYGGVPLDDRITLRVFRRGAIDFNGNPIGRFGKVVVPHDQALILPKTDAYSIHHFSTYDITKFEKNHSHYSTEEARAFLKLGRRFSGVKLIGKPIYFFLKYMFVSGAWRWGWRGLIISAEYCFYFFNIQAKMWEMENNVNLESIEKTYDNLKEKLLKDFDR